MNTTSTGQAATAPETVTRVTPGGIGAITSVYDACQASLFGYAASLTRDDGAAEEIVQESFVRLVQQFRRGPMPDEPRAWLYAVCTNLAISRSRRRSIVGRWTHLLTPRGDDAMDEAAETTVLRREQHDQLGRVLDTLPRDDRVALLLAAEGFSGREIATIIGKSEGATRNLLWRARLQLRERLQDGGPG